MREISELEICIMYLVHAIIYVIISIYFIICGIKEQGDWKFKIKIDILPSVIFLFISLLYLTINIIRLVRL